VESDTNLLPVGVTSTVLDNMFVVHCPGDWLSAVYTKLRAAMLLGAVAVTLYAVIVADIKYRHLNY